MQRTAQNWLVLMVLTHQNASAVGVIIALQFAPQVLLLPWTGPAADRFDQRKLLVFTQSSMGLLALGLGVLTVTGAVKLWEVDVFALLFGAAAAFDAPVRQVFVSQLVGDEDLHNAVTLNSMSFNSAALVGPAVSGFLIAAVGTGWAFVLNGTAFLAVLSSLFLLRPAELYLSARGDRARGSFLEGARYVWRRADLLAILLMLLLLGLFALNFPIFISTMAVGAFHADARGYGALSSMMAVGTVTGAIWSARNSKPTVATLFWSSALLASSLAVAAIAPSYWTFALTLIAMGVACLIFLNTTNALMQLSTEASMRGRVMAFRVSLYSGGIALGAPIVGWIADHFGPRWALGVGAASGVAAAVVAAATLARKRSAYASVKRRSKS